MDTDRKGGIAMEKTDLWNKVSRPPESVLKTIRGGRLAGMTDISPQWRYKVLTEAFGPCGVGWKFTIDRQWTEQGTEDQIFAFANISLYIKVLNNWSDPIPGTGGSMLVAKESKGLHSSDEAYKMAVTDALSTACKLLGVASDIYMGLWDGSKYRDAPEPKPEKETKKKAPIMDFARVRSELERLSGSGEAFDTVLSNMKITTYHDIKNNTEKKKQLWERLNIELDKFRKAGPAMIHTGKDIPCPELDGEMVAEVDCDICDTKGDCPNHAMTENP